MRAAFGPLSLATLVFLIPSAASAYVVKRTPSGERVRWHRSTVTLELDVSMADRFGEDASRQAVTIAADAWRGYGGPELRVAPTITASPYRPLAAGAQVLVMDPWPHPPTLLAVTATSYDQRSGEILDADILVNPAPPIGLLREGEDDVGAARYDLAAVVTHEAGHLLGLGESDADPLATMWPRIGRGDTHQRTLALDDEAGITEVYEGLTLDPTTTGGCAAHVGARPRATLSWLAAALAALAFGWFAWQRHNHRGVAHRGRGSRARPGLAIAFVAAAVVAFVPGRATPQDEPVSFRISRALHAGDHLPEVRAAHLGAALDDDQPEVRRAAMVAMASTIQRNDRDRAERLFDDPDPTVRRMARRVAVTARRAPPERTVALDEIDEAIWAPFAATVAIGRVVATEARVDDDGMHYTEATVDSDHGRVVLRVPGGCVHGVCQQIGESAWLELRETVLVDPDGVAWARVRGDVAYDGWLPTDAAVRLRRGT